MKKKVFGVLLLMETVFLLLSAIIALCYGEGDFTPLLTATAICAIAGVSLFLPNRKKVSTLYRKDCYIIISGVWIVFSMFGMIPFLLYGSVDTVADAFFETMSGFTTTGATVMNNIDEQPHGLLFWRSMLQWLGGLGIMLFSIALLPTFNRNSKQLFSTEAASISASRVKAKAQETARGILVIYTLLTIVCTICYFIGPMSWFDAICHSMTTLGTGGFSTHQASIAYFQSPYLEYVCSIFMFLSGINFALYFFAMIGNWTPFKTNEEFHWYCWATLFFVFLFFAIFLLNPNDAVNPQVPVDAEDCFRTALFHVTSIFTSAGFQSSFCDYNVWGASFWMPTMLLMVSGACAGSSSGGLKLIRFIICFKNMRNEFMLHKHPNAVVPVKISRRIIDQTMVSRTLAFIYIFMIVMVIGTFLLSVFGMDFDTALGSCISAISNTGPGFGQTGPYTTYADIPEACK